MKCRHCQQPLDLSFLDLTSAPPSNAYLDAAALDRPETWYPLRLLACRHCRLVQTEDHAGREALFTDDYAYFSSYSTSWLEHSQRYVAQMVDRFGLDRRSLVAEVAANDGYLLQYVQARDIPCYGIEPTASTAAAARRRGIEIVERFFGVELGAQLARDGRKVDLVAANNVLAHVPDINDFAGGFAHLLKPQGVATFEFPHLLSMVSQRQFDTAYHEHYSYLSLHAVQTVFGHQGLDVFDVERLPTHGGSLRVYAQRVDSGVRGRSGRIYEVLDDERRAGMLADDFYTGFQASAESVKHDLLGFLLEARRQGARVGAYGAAAKGNTLLNFAGVRPDLLPWVVDRNPAKSGRWMPGSRIPIVDESRLRLERPDYVLILPWNLREEIVAQLAYVREWGGRFVTVVPSLQVHA